MPVTNGLLFLIVSIHTLYGPCALYGQQLATVQSSAEDEKAESAKEFEYFNALASIFEAKMATDEPLQVVKEPLLKWTIDSSWQGSFYVWTCKQRPVLIGCFLSDTEFQDKRRSLIEMHTLVDDAFQPIPIEGAKGKHLWAPETTSPSTLQLPGLPAPANVATKHRIQMRQIAEACSVNLYEKNTNAKEQLRMLATPIYRYPENGTLSGAIYAFVRTNGTDPEFLLGIELDSESKTPGWRIRPIRFATRRLELTYQDAVVWEVGKYSGNPTTMLTGPYVIVTTVESNTTKYNALRDKTIEDAKKLDVR